MFERKVYAKMKRWKEEYAGRYACLLVGARRVGKSTVAEEFAKREYQSYIKIDFANMTEEMLEVFEDIATLDLFFLRLQVHTGVSLVERQSVILFDEIQLYPKARQAIKYLVKDGRYDYIETGSLISLKKNVRGIVIPSEEYRIGVYPMDYEEFMWAAGGSPDLIQKACDMKISLGESTSRSLMRDFRLYMAIGGMPQAVEAYLERKSFDYIDGVKREIINLYLEDLKKIDPSGRLSDIYSSVPSQLALKKRRFVVTAATGKQKTRRDEERLFDLIDAKIVLPCYHIANPGVALSQTRDTERYKLYMSDIGLFTTMLFHDSGNRREDIYKKLLSDKLDADLGYLYENAVAQMLVSDERQLYYHTWKKPDSNRYYEIDFLITFKNKVIPIEVKSSSVRNHESIDRFSAKYSQYVGERYLISQKDVSVDGMLELKPVYMLPFMLKNYRKAEENALDF